MTSENKKTEIKDPFFYISMMPIIPQQLDDTFYGHGLWFLGSGLAREMDRCIERFFQNFPINFPKEVEDYKEKNLERLRNIEKEMAGEELEVVNPKWRLKDDFRIFTDREEDNWMYWAFPPVSMCPKFFENTYVNYRYCYWLYDDFTAEEIWDRMKAIEELHQKAQKHVYDLVNSKVLCMTDMGVATMRLYALMLPYVIEYVGLEKALRNKKEIKELKERKGRVVWDFAPEKTIPSMKVPGKLSDAIYRAYLDDLQSRGAIKKYNCIYDKEEKKTRYEIFYDDKSLEIVPQRIEDVISHYFHFYISKPMSLSDMTLDMDYNETREWYYVCSDLAYPHIFTNMYTEIERMKSCSFDHKKYDLPEQGIIIALGKSARVYLRDVTGACKINDIKLPWLRRRSFAKKPWKHPAILKELLKPFFDMLTLFSVRAPASPLCELLNQNYSQIAEIEKSVALEHGNIPLGIPSIEDLEKEVEQLNRERRQKELKHLITVKERAEKLGKTDLAMYKLTCDRLKELQEMMREHGELDEDIKIPER